MLASVLRRLYIYSEQYFEDVPPDVWAFTIGGYQVCHKWLKHRKGRTLSFEDLHQTKGLCWPWPKPSASWGRLTPSTEDRFRNWFIV